MCSLELGIELFHFWTSNVAEGFSIADCELLYISEYFFTAG
jgi:hypothetical protein